MRRQGLAAGTAVKYDHNIKEWATFRRRAALPVFFIEQTDLQVAYELADYAVFLKLTRGIAADTIRGKLAAVRWLHLVEVGRQLPDHAVTKQTMAVIRKQSPAVQHRPGVFLADIAAFYETAAAAGGTQLAIWRGILLAFHMLLRGGEYLGLDNGRVDPDKCILRGGVSFRSGGHEVPLAEWRSADHARVLLRASKTDQQKKGSVLIIGSCGGGQLCPVRAIAELLLAHPPGVTEFSPIMTVLRKGALSVVSKSQLVMGVKAMVAHQGRSTTGVATHAMRVGGATTLAHAGASERQIKLAGGWLSDSYLVYIRDNMADFRRVTADLSASSGLVMADEVVLR